jgi:hypothetical protein
MVSAGDVYRVRVQLQGPVAVSDVGKEGVKPRVDEVRGALGQ